MMYEPKNISKQLKILASVEAKEESDAWENRKSIFSDKDGLWKNIPNEVLVYIIALYNRYNKQHWGRISYLAPRQKLTFGGMRGCYCHNQMWNPYNIPNPIIDVSEFGETYWHAVRHNIRAVEHGYRKEEDLPHPYYSYATIVYNEDKNRYYRDKKNYDEVYDNARQNKANMNKSITEAREALVKKKLIPDTCDAVWTPNSRVLFRNPHEWGQKVDAMNMIPSKFQYKYMKDAVIKYAYHSQKVYVKGIIKDYPLTMSEKMRDCVALVVLGFSGYFRRSKGAYLKKDTLFIVVRPLDKSEKKDYISKLDANQLVKLKKRYKNADWEVN